MSRWGSNDAHNQNWRSQSKSVQSSESGMVNTAAKAQADAQFDNAIKQLQDSSGNVAAVTGQRQAAIERDYAQLLGMLAQQGGYERGRIGRDFNSQAGSVGAALAGTGLYNSTIQDNMRQGVERNRAEALLGLEESLRGQRAEALGMKTQLSDTAAGQGLTTSTQFATALANIMGQKAGTIPTMSRQQSISESLGF